MIVSRARDAAHARHLYAVGVTDAVPETIEASLQLSEAALVGLGVPTGPVIASIHEKRDEFRRELQEAAGQAGRPETRSIRAKTLREVVTPRQRLAMSATRPCVKRSRSSGAIWNTALGVPAAAQTNGKRCRSLSINTMGALVWPTGGTPPMA